MVGILLLKGCSNVYLLGKPILYPSEVASPSQKRFSDLYLCIFYLFSVLRLKFSISSKALDDDFFAGSKMIKKVYRGSNGVKYVQVMI